MLSSWLNLIVFTKTLKRILAARIKTTFLNKPKRKLHTMLMLTRSMTCCLTNLRVESWLSLSTLGKMYWMRITVNCCETIQWTASKTRKAKWRDTLRSLSRSHLTALSRSALIIGDRVGSQSDPVITTLTSSIQKIKINRTTDKQLWMKEEGPSISLKILTYQWAN